ncbi:MAG: aldehyde dehydrogenase family protein, partial [Tepidisphaeraceae bacterium]
MPSVLVSAEVDDDNVTDSARPVLIGGQWRASQCVETFRAVNPRTGQVHDDAYPVSCWPDLDAALAAAASAGHRLRTSPDAADRIGAFLDAYATALEANAEALVAAASFETGLPATPRLKDVELPRTTGQLRQAAAAARDGSWKRPVIDTKAGLRSCLEPIGPVLVIGPNNFPFAFNGIAGGDFAAAIAAGNPVIAKAHPLHPTTSRLLAEAAHIAATNAGLPLGTVQMLYHLSPSDGLRMVRDPRLSAVAFTGGRHAGLKLKAAADAAGKPFFGEMSSINPTVLLPGALIDNADGIAEQFAASVQMGTGQFCTKPGLVLLTKGQPAERFIETAAAKLSSANPGVLFSAGGQAALRSAIRTLQAAGATLVAGGEPVDDAGCSVQNTLLRCTAKQFLGNPTTFQTEAFGNASMVVIADDADQLLAVLNTLEGNLTGSIYSAPSGADDDAYDAVAEVLRPKVGRLINDKMPTGVAVSPAQNHGGPYPATSQSHFTAVGIPASLLRFTQLASYDNVRAHRLPPCLQNVNPTGVMWR